MVNVTVRNVIEVPKKRTIKKRVASSRKSAPKRSFRRSIVKSFAGVLLFALAFFALLNWGFVTARVGYFFHKPDPETVLKPSSTIRSTREGTWPKDTLAIPSLGIIAPVIYGINNNEDSFQTALKNGVVHYPETALPGEVGNVFIFGHSSDYAWSGGDYKSVFALLPKIEVGEEIKLTDTKGFLYTYLVTSKEVVSSKEVRVLNQDTEGKKTITLQTSYPIGTALRRYIVHGQLRQTD